MGRLTISQNYDFLPLSGLKQVDLPELVILTGLNGCGKSRLFNAIITNEASRARNNGEMARGVGIPIGVAIDGHQVDQREILHADFGEITISGSQLVTYDDFTQEVKGSFDVFEQARVRSGEHNLPLADWLHNENTARSGVGRLNALNALTLLKGMQDTDADNIRLEDFQEHAHLFGVNSGQTEASQFSHNFARVFATYQYSIDKLNWFNYLEHKSPSGRREELEVALTHLEAAKPWDIVNRVFAETNFEYRIKEPRQFSESGQRYQLELTKIHNGSIVPLEHLSTGEKIILALALAKYNVGQKNGSNIKLLLLDEPDAPLHPARIGEFIHTVRDVFCKRGGQAVIMATHSPSTIAAAPAGSIYELNTDTEPSRLMHVEKHEALRLLSSGFIGITEGENESRITFEVREAGKHILFVEGITDKQILTAAWRKLTGSAPEFTIINAYDCSGVEQRLKDRGDEYQNKIVMGLFDFDDAYKKYKALSAFDIAVGDVGNCKSNRQNDRYAILLPIPGHRSGYAGYEQGHNHLHIELLFEDTFLSAFMDDCLVDHRHYENIKEFDDGYKTDFANHVEAAATATDFQHFRPLVELIQGIMQATR